MAGFCHVLYRLNRLGTDLEKEALSGNRASVGEVKVLTLAGTSVLCDPLPWDEAGLQVQTGLVHFVFLEILNCIKDS